MMGLCYCCSLVTLRIFFLIAVVMMNFQAALLVTLVGIVASAPISDKLDIMNKDTIEQAHSLINKILQDIPTTHAAWINSKSMTLGDSKTMLELQFLKKDMNIPSAPVLQNISTISTLELCLANIMKGLQLHLILLTEIGKADTLDPTDHVKSLEAKIEELLHLIEELQSQAGFNSTKQASDEHTTVHGLAKNLTTKYKTQVAAHLTLQQLQDFSCDILRSILSMSSSTAETPNTIQFCVNAGGL
ncbi:colony stimulating factor 3 (granulocyte) a [Puntigrus tetrazona]|uniref:colony stimulating factor 3 (granulocyte) a n=1 Tax=Puntigrus tetrazona TaxID=1606681 RepID=UPI001C8A2B85|nr:colony stimulating factor 3 (granulocyte) a [Puntigrus tetrazona]